MTNNQINSNSQNPKQKYDLEDRTARFSEQIIDFSRKLPQDTVTRPIISQLVRAGTSIGANYCEADEASSKKDFLNKIAIAKKETKETKYWLRIIAHTLPEFKEEARKLWKEAQELNLILAAIIRNSKNSIGH
jgi:four helix bundle protein